MIRTLKSLNFLVFFPQNTEIWAFNPKIRVYFISVIWVCFLAYPFTLGPTYLFPPLITEFFEITKLCYSQVMPIIWRILLTLEYYNPSYPLSIGIPELAYAYNIETMTSPVLYFK
ncbi:hypothetical protein Hanom_Chr05g00423891 [Helianthus anomalus]